MDITNLQGTVKLRNGLKMPYLGLGVFKSLDGDEVINAVKFALLTGYRLIDTAMIYKNEAGVGKAILESHIPREEIFVTSKVWNDDQGYDSTIKAYEKSLNMLNLDYLDLYLIHWPVKDKYNETWQAMVDLYNQGKIKAIGVSNFLQFQLEDLIDKSDFVPMVNQMEFHPQLIQPELLEYCKNLNIQYEAWSPLMQGKIFELKEINDIANKYDRSPAQIILRWNLQMGVVTIPKSVNPDRIKSNSEIFDFSLTDSEVAKINSLDIGKRIGPDPADFNF